ncbi:MAG TPA: NrfD/PsrC family molybdoenzyme membrane anchor subunit [Candidatus Baltobacteraceae bacterium]|jgi:formate-dependent nitrite reductase membrane component NrfD
MAEHFVQPPHWEVWITLYFFLAGIAGGSYTLGTMLRLWGSQRDEATARIAFMWSFPIVVVCGILLTIDLGKPLRFWHMMVNTTPGSLGLNFKPWSPISLGTWALLIFSLFAFVSFLEVMTKRGNDRNVSGTMIVWNIVGSLVALFLASYTGVVLSVSNQPVWSDSYAIGGLFVASALSASAAFLAFMSRFRSDDAIPTEARLEAADAWFVLLELIMIIAFFVTLSGAGELWRETATPWLIGWILIFASFIPSLRRLAGGGRVRYTASGGAVAATRVLAGTGTSAIIVIVGVLILRFVVIYSAQFQ